MFLWNLQFFFYLFHLIDIFLQLVSIEYLGVYLPNANNLKYMIPKVKKSATSADINILLTHGCGEGDHGWAFKGGLCFPGFNINQVCHGGKYDPHTIAMTSVHEIGHNLGISYF